MESDYNTLCSELDNIFLECPTDRSGCAEVRSLVDAFVNKYGKDKPQLRSIITEQLDPYGSNASISRSCFKRMIMEWIGSFNHDVPTNHYAESSTNVDRDVFEYDASSHAHSTPLGRFNHRVRKIPAKKLSYSPALGFTSDSSENHVSPYQEELKSFRTASKAHNSSLENSLVKAEQKIFALEEELRTLKLHSRKDTERLKEEINQLKHFEKLYAGNVNKIEKYAETLNNLTKEYYRLKVSKEDLFKEFTNLEIEQQRLKSEIEAKNASIKTLETWKRVQTEELVVLNDSKSILETEVLKLKNDVRSRSENEESLLLRIGELQSEKQKLQTELDEVMIVENLKMSSSSPFGKSLSQEDEFSDRNEENRESGISVRSELMDSLGFTSCINETFNSPYLSIVNRTDAVSFACGTTSVDLLYERTQTFDQEVQTELVEERKLYLVEKEIQTERIHEETSVQTIEIEVQTQKEEIYETRLSRIEIGVQIDITKDKSSKEVQTDEISENRILKDEKDSQTEVICVTRDYPENAGVNTFHWSFLDNTLDCLTPIKMEIDNSLEEFQRTFRNFGQHGMAISEGCELNSDINGRLTSASLNSLNDSVCISTSSDQSVSSYDIVPVLRKRNMSTPRLRPASASLTTVNDSVYISSDRRPASASLTTVNDSVCISTSSERSVTSHEIVPVLRRPNMSTPRLRIRRIESRRLSCLDVYNKPVSICRSDTYQKLTFSRKISTIFSGIVSFLSPGVRLSEEGSFNSIDTCLSNDRRCKSNIWVCIKTLLWVVTATLLLCLTVIIFFVISWKNDGIPQQYFWPYIVLKYPNGPPPS